MGRQLPDARDATFELYLISRQASIANGCDATKTKYQRTKNGESQTIGLSAAAREVLIERQKSGAILHPWVFVGGNPQNKTTSDNHLTEPKKAWKKIISNAGIKDLRIHDLRRTAGSLMAISGINTPTIMKALGHKSMSAAAIYQRVNADPVKDFVNDPLYALFALSDFSCFSSTHSPSTNLITIALLSPGFFRPCFLQSSSYSACPGR
jgi:hypothetical protein